MADIDSDTKFAGTQLGRDGKRYPAGQVPDGLEGDPQLLSVFGMPGAGKVPVWNADTHRLEWGDASAPTGGSVAGPGEHLYVYTDVTDPGNTGALNIPDGGTLGAWQAPLKSIITPGSSSHWTDHYAWDPLTPTQVLVKTGGFHTLNSEIFVPSAASGWIAIVPQDIDNNLYFPGIEQSRRNLAGGVPIRTGFAFTWWIPANTVMIVSPAQTSGGVLSATYVEFGIGLVVAATIVPAA